MLSRICLARMNEFWELIHLLELQVQGLVFFAPCCCLSLIYFLVIFWYNYNILFDILLGYY